MREEIAKEIKDIWLYTSGGYASIFNAIADYILMKEYVARDEGYNEGLEDGEGLK